MKKNLCAILAIVAVGIGTGMAYSLSDNADSLSPLQMENLEALAEDEGSGLTVNCFCKSNWFSPNVCSANASGSYCGGDPCANHDSNCR